MIHRALIRQGESLVWLARPNTLATAEAIDGNWTCHAGLYDSAGAEAVAAFQVSDKHTLSGDEYFLVALTPAQTAPLAVGDYVLAIDVRNSTVTPQYAQETPVEVQIVAQKLPA